MELAEIMEEAIKPAYLLLPDNMSSPAVLDRANVMMLAIGLQESRFTMRRQMGNGPARGFWQFEKGGGVRGVCRFPSTEEAAESLCEARGVAFGETAIWNALEKDDILAAGFARLLLYTDSKPLPQIGNPQAGWEYYVRNWRPGKPHRDTWDKFYNQSVAYVRGG